MTDELDLTQYDVRLLSYIKQLLARATALGHADLVKEELGKGVTVHSAKPELTAQEFLFWMSSYMAKLYKAVAFDAKFPVYRETLDRAQFMLDFCEMIGFVGVYLSAHPLSANDMARFSLLRDAAAVRHATLPALSPQADAIIGSWFFAQVDVRNVVGESEGGSHA